MKSLTTILTFISSLVLGILSLSACANQTETSKTSHAYQSPGKPGNDIAINYRISKERVAVGEAVQIHLSSVNNKQDVIARLQTTDKLLTTSSKELTFQAETSKQQSEELVITVIPQEEGIHLVTIFAKELSVAYEKPIAIQIVAGDKPVSEYLEINGRLEQQEDGETVISMPAEEK
ncbi:hypothetical protein [Kangiella koreensis]|uniref:Lipoprotein n=1 Tax=Kangiella koreensis (strain DSM 16069 / JCM 12317 / KCTC 12182 / SW-125) TaxID=523791 RepID=C7R8E7_KANKD|nr:hypothetical protein [Kangiella koreensis]ACV27712.1 hypothetical protein Kkor_2303 [Kangiella koreensis DSM 16069]